MTYHQETGITVKVFEPLVRGTAKVASLDNNITNYSHELSANGGFDRMTVSLADDRLSLDDWIEQGVGRHIEVYNSAGVVVWEGFINVVRGSIGAHTIEVGPLLEVGNRVMVSYAPVDYNLSPPAVGDTTVTPVVENTRSQERFGIIEKVINGGRVTDDEAENIRDTFLAENAYLSTSSTLSFGGSGGDPTVTLECLGYWYWLNSYVFNDGTSGAIQADDRLLEILTGNPNSGMYATPVLDTNNQLIPAETQEDKIAMALVKEILALGGATDQRYTLGFYENRQPFYREIPTDPAYKTALSDQGQRILTYEGFLVYPWDVRPAQWIFISDALVGRYTGDDLYEDPRYMFIEQVSYSAPWNITMTGSRVGTFEQVMARFGIGDF